MNFSRLRSYLYRHVCRNPRVEMDCRSNGSLRLNQPKFVFCCYYNSFLHHLTKTIWADVGPLVFNQMYSFWFWQISFSVLFSSVTSLTPIIFRSICYVRDFFYFSQPSPHRFEFLTCQVKRLSPLFCSWSLSLIESVLEKDILLYVIALLQIKFLSQCLLQILCT